MALTMIPNNVFAQGETSVSNEEVVSSENLDFVETTTPASIQFRDAENNRTFDIQWVDYRRSSMNPGARYESKWEGVAPYAPLFGHMVNNGKYTRPLGKENGDLGWGWGSSDYMTGYLLIDVDKFGDYENSPLEKDEYGLTNLGIVRVDNKYSRNNDFSSWKESIEEAFKEYNGNEGFTKKGYAGGSAYQETKLVIWDGYKRVRDISGISGKEYIKNVEDKDSSNTVKRQELANYIKKHLENGAKLQGYITTDYGLKDVYEPSESTYSTKEKQIRYVPHIKITGVTYDVELEYENAPEGIELPKVVEVNAGHKLKVPEIYGYTISLFDKYGKELDNDFVINANIEVLVKISLDFVDTDKDGFSDSFEKKIGTNPNIADTDEDGLSDYEELYIGNPTVKDSDTDLDGDGISNYDEIKIYKTSPQLEDTDFDGISDYDEINRYNTNPNSFDTDEDGIIDGIELENGLNPTVSNKGQSIYKKIEKTPNTDGNAKLILETKIPVEELNSIMVIPLYGDDSIVPKTSVGYIDGYEINLNRFDEAKMTFHFDIPSGKKLGVDYTPTIYYVNEEKRELEEVEGQQLDIRNKTVYVNPTHFSKYVLLDKYERQQVIDQNIRLLEENNKAYSEKISPLP